MSKRDKTTETNKTQNKMQNQTQNKTENKQDQDCKTYPDSQQKTNG